MEKWLILDQNHGLTPLEKCQYLDSLNFSFYSVERRFSVLEYRKTVSRPTLPKNFFSVEIGLVMKFNNVLDRKETFSFYKNKIFQFQKIFTFPKGLTHADGQKCNFFFICFWSKKDLK